MYLTEMSLKLGFNKNWLYVMKKKNREKYDYLASFDEDLFKSLLIARNTIEELILVVEEATHNNEKRDIIKDLNLYDVKRYVQIHALNDGLFKVRDRVLDTQLRFIRKLEAIVKALEK